MYAQVEKSKENTVSTDRRKSLAVANAAQKKSNVKQGFGFVDNRPESIVQRKLQQVANSSPKSTQFKASANNYHARQQPTIQKKENTDPHAPMADTGQQVEALRQTVNNSTLEQRADAEWYGNQQTTLHALEGQIHTWMREHGHLANNQQRASMAGYLNNIEDLHNTLVGVQIQQGHPLWLPGGSTMPDRQRAVAVWDSVLNNTGNIKIHQADAAFRTNTLGDIAKLLQHQHGRDMLHELNAYQNGNKNQQIRIGANWKNAFAGMNREHQAGSWATPTIAGTDRHRRLMGGGANQGTGSFVQIDRNHRETETGEHGDTGVVMPHYLTLGHELGHALHNLRGTSTVQSAHNAAFDGLSQMEKTLWSNSEEHQNITQNENVIRAEHGLPNRAYHRPPLVVRATRMKYDLCNRIDQIHKDFPEHEEELKRLDPYEPLFYEQEGINEPAFYEQANRYINSLYRWRSAKTAGKWMGGLATLAAIGYGGWRYMR